MRTLNLLLAFSIALIANAAQAEVCSKNAILQGPIPLAFERGGFAEPRRACPRSEAQLGASGGAVVDTANFYGNLNGRATTALSFEVLEGLEVFARLDPIFYQQVITSLSADTFGFGHSQLGFSLRALERSDVYVATFARLTLPTALSLYQNAYPIGAEAGFSAEYRLLPAFHLHANLAGAARSSISLAQSQTRVGLNSTLGSELFLGEWVSLVGDVQTNTLLRKGLDHVAVAGALRMKLGGGFSADLSALVPLAGSERKLAEAAFNLRYRIR